MNEVAKKYKPLED